MNNRAEFSANAAGAGFRHFFLRSLREQLQAEIYAQFEKFRSTGLKLDHVNGHLHFHLHPTVFHMLIRDARKLGVTRIRMTFDPLWLNLRLASGQWLYRLAHAAIFHLLSACSRPALRRPGLRHAQQVFGLLQNARVEEAYVLGLLERLPPGDSELYSHPSLDE